MLFFHRQENFCTIILARLHAMWFFFEMLHPPVRTASIHYSACLYYIYSCAIMTDFNHHRTSSVLEFQCQYFIIHYFPPRGLAIRIRVSLENMLHWSLYSITLCFTLSRDVCLSEILF